LTKWSDGMHLIAAVRYVVAMANMDMIMPAIFVLLLLFDFIGTVPQVF
jgi:hypothetical protein